MAEAQLIALDWGTTSARAYLMGRGGEILAERSKPLGIMQVNRNAEEKSLVLEVAFGAAFEELCGDWSETLPLTPIIACGMVGSRQGWIEAAYRPAPADYPTQNLPNWPPSRLAMDNVCMSSLGSWIQKNCRT